LAILAAGTFLVAVFLGDRLDQTLIQRRWHNIAPGYELVAQAESRYQNLAVGRRAGQFSLYCDGQISADFPDPYTFAPLAHFWLCQHPRPGKVLVLGGGAEGLLAEVLRHPVEAVDYVELDPRQVELVRPLLAEADRRALSDPRVRLHHMDARHFVKTQRDRFDLVLARLPEPISAQRARFYTDEFYAELRRAMTERSVFCLMAAAAPTELSAISREYLGSLRATLRRHFPQVIVGWGDPAQLLAATQPGLITTDPEELAERYRQRDVHSPWFDPAWFAGATDWLAPDKLLRRSADLDAAGPVPVSSDLKPVVYIQRLVLWEAQRGPAGLRSGGQAGGFLARLRTTSLPKLSLAMAAVGGLILVGCRLHAGTCAGWAAGAITLSVGTTGLATMALSILWLFAFQNLYGYVYQRVGWIVALFMAGLVVGCVWAGRVSRNWQGLIRVDLLLGLLALTVPLLLPALAAIQTGPVTLTIVEWCISALVTATGLLGGAAFACAGRLQLSLTARPGAAAGWVVGADHLGACLGAPLCGILLVPVFGTATTALMLAAIKLVSAGLLLAGRRAADTRSAAG